MKTSIIYSKILTTILVLGSSLMCISQDVITKESKNTIKGDQLLYGGLGFMNPEPFTFSVFSASGGGNPTTSANINYQYAVHRKVLIGAFFSYYRVNADYNTSLDQIADSFEDITLDDLISNFDCIVLGNCATTISERVSVYTIGGKLSYTKNIVSDLETYMSGYLGYSFNRRRTITEAALNILSTELDLGVNVPTIIYFSSVGLRYYFSPRLAFQGEFGYGNSHLLNVGVSYKL